MPKHRRTRKAAEMVTVRQPIILVASQDWRAIDARRDIRDARHDAGARIVVAKTKKV
jgi:hypothetical protein